MKEGRLLRMESKLFQLLPSKPQSPLIIPINTLKTAHTLSLKPRRRRLSPVLNSTDSTEGGTADDNSQPQLQPQPKTVEIRFKSRSKRRNKQMKEAKAIAPDPPPKKKWEDMNLTEKALELYVGEKGALFWLNKFAYASIFIMIGGWIVFRFVGPSLNLYQLDTPPLPPSAIFKDAP